MKRRTFITGIVPALGVMQTLSDGRAAPAAPTARVASVSAPTFGEILLEHDLSNSLPQNSEPKGGDWQPRADRLVQGRFGGPFFLLMGQPDWGNYTVWVNLRFPALAAGTEAGLALQMRENGEYVVFSLKEKKGGLFALLRIESPTGMSLPVNAPYLPELKRTTMVGDQHLLPIDPAVWHELRVDVHGSEFYGYVDGQHVVDYDFKVEQPAWYPHKPLWPESPTKGRIALMTIGWPAEFRRIQVRSLLEFSHICTPMKGRRDAKGQLLPRQSYSETMRLMNEWLIHSNDVVEKDVAPPSLQSLDPHVLAIWVFSDNEGLDYDVGEFAFNSGTFLAGAVQYYLYSGDTRMLAKAEELAEWGIANSTAAEWAAPYLAPSLVRWLPDGSWEGFSYETWGLEPDKSAYLGDAYIRLYVATGKVKYLEAAKRIAGTLVKLRQPEGNWPFRINPETGRIIYMYSHSQLWYIRFFERLARMTGEAKWLSLRDGALAWLLKNPVKTNDWRGLYGDYESGQNSYDQWVPLEFAQYLIGHRAEHPEYLDVALGIVDWVYKTLVVKPGLFPEVPGLIEQTGYSIVIAHHELRLAETHAVLWGATGDRKHRDTALTVANSVTWLLMSDGKMRMSHWQHAAYAYMRCLIFNNQFTRIMTEIPESAPHDENHLLHISADVSDIRYGEMDIRYKTVGPGAEILILREAPRAVQAGGQTLPKSTAKGEDGWSYDSETHLMRVRHRQPAVQIML